MLRIMHMHLYQINSAKLESSDPDADKIIIQSEAKEDDYQRKYHIVKEIESFSNRFFLFSDLKQGCYRINELISKLPEKPSHNFLSEDDLNIICEFVTRLIDFIGIYYIRLKDQKRILEDHRALELSKLRKSEDIPNVNNNKSLLIEPIGWNGKIEELEVEYYKLYPACIECSLGDFISHFLEKIRLSKIEWKRNKPNLISYFLFLHDAGKIDIDVHVSKTSWKWSVLENHFNVHDLSKSYAKLKKNSTNEGIPISIKCKIGLLKKGDYSFLIKK